MGNYARTWLNFCRVGCTRLAYANGVPSPAISVRFSERQVRNWSARLDRAMPDRILQFFWESIPCIPLEDIAALTIAPDPLARLRFAPAGIASSRVAHQRRRRPGCNSARPVWRKTKRPIFAEGWSLATRVSCFSPTAVGFETGARPAEHGLAPFQPEASCAASDLRPCGGARGALQNEPVPPPHRRSTPLSA